LQEVILALADPYKCAGHDTALDFVRDFVTSTGLRLDVPSGGELPFARPHYVYKEASWGHDATEINLQYEITAIQDDTAAEGR
jgi:hypothetical protein